MKNRIILMTIGIVAVIGVSGLAKDKLTIDNCEMLKTVMTVTDAKDPIIVEFAEKYEDERIEFDGYISLIETDEDGEYDVYVRAARDGESYVGVRFKLEVEPEDLFENSTLPDYIAEGKRIHIVGDVDSYNEKIGGGINLDVRKIKKAEEEVKEADSNDTSSSTTTEGIRPEIKDTLDSYEAFFDKYVEVMRAVSDDSADLSLLGEYFELLSSYSDMISKMTDLESDLTTEELGYYIEVTGRIYQKIATVE